MEGGAVVTLAPDEMAAPVSAALAEGHGDGCRPAPVPAAPHCSEFPSTDEFGVNVSSGDVAEEFLECPGFTMGDGKFCCSWC